MIHALSAFERELFVAAGIEDDPSLDAALEDAEEHARLIEKLVAARKARGLRQKNVAKRMGTTQSRVSDIERIGGDPRLSTVMRYGRAVGLRVRFVPVATDVPDGWEDAGRVEVRTVRPAVDAATRDGWEPIAHLGA